MRHSHKKISLEDIPLLSITEKLREKSSKSHFKRECCQKQNRESKGKDSNLSSRRSSKKKKFLEEEIQKLLQKRLINEEGKFNEIKINNATQIEELKGNLKEMKSFIAKLSVEEKQTTSVKEDTIEQTSKKQYEKMCIDYTKKLEALTDSLEIQKSVNAKLEEALIQSQLFAKQTQDYSESINRQLGELAQKHLSCEQNARQLKQKTTFLQYLNCQMNKIRLKLEECEQYKKIQENKQNKLKEEISQLLCSKKIVQEELTHTYEELNKSKQQNTSLFNENRKLTEAEKLFEQYIKESNLECEELQEKVSELEGELAKEQQKLIKQQEKLTKQQEKLIKQQEKRAREQEKVAQQEEKIAKLTQLNKEQDNQKLKLQLQLKKLQREFNCAKQDLGNTENKLKGLISMEKKCQELFQQIKMEKQRWDDFNNESILEKEVLQKQLKALLSQKQSLILKVDNLEQIKIQTFQTIQQLKSQIITNKDEKGLLQTNIKTLQAKIESLQFEIEQIQNQKENLSSKLNLCQQTLEEKENQWKNEKIKLQKKLQWLEKQKLQIECEVKGTMEAAKKRNDEFHATNLSLQTEIAELSEEKFRIQQSYKSLEAQITELSKQNKSYKILIDSNQQKISQLYSNIDDLQTQIKEIQEKRKEAHQKEKEALREWENKYESISFKLDSCIIQLKECKEENSQLSGRLTDRQQKIVSLSTIRQNLEQRLSQNQLRLSESQTARLSLTSELQDYHLATKRNQQARQQQKNLIDNELNKKNKLIYELKETIKLIKEESFKIQQEMQQFKKIQEFEEIVNTQLSAMQKFLKGLEKHKNELELQLNILKGQNNRLSDKIFKMQEDYQVWQRVKEKTQIKLAQLQDENTMLKNNLKQTTEQKQSIEKLLSMKQYKLQQQTKERQTTIDSFEKSAVQYRKIISQSHENSTKLINSIKQKEEIIQNLNSKLQVFQQKKRKIMNEVHNIQNQISELALKNSMLEEENKALQTQTEKKKQEANTLLQKNQLLEESNNAFEEQNTALVEQAKILNDELSALKQSSREKQEKCNQNIREVYQICQSRRSEAVTQLNAKIQQLANELAGCINKLNSKNTELEVNEKQCFKLKQSLEESQSLLCSEKNKGEKLTTDIAKITNQMELLKQQLSIKEMEITNLNRDKTIMKEKIVEHQSKYEILKRKNEYLVHEKCQTEREMENQNVSIKVLREENRNIEKVLTDQINQRKTIIEELVNEKNKLYSKLHHER